jgi:endonuclease III
MGLSTDTANPMNPLQRQVFFTRLRDANPHPKTELEYRNPFELLIAVLLSAQATDVSVNKATLGLFAAAPTANAMVKLGLPAIENHIKTIGLFRNKAKNVFATCEILVKMYGGQIPQNREALESLPGVGRKTANVVLNTAFGWPVMAVDTHIFRVANRTGLAPAPDVVKVEERLMKRIPKDFLVDAHHWLILHGRYTCKARNPECWRCGVVDVCRFKGKLLD